jgi:cation diffusion facilitator family transporter
MNAIPQSNVEAQAKCGPCGMRFASVSLAVNLALAVLKATIGVFGRSRALMAAALYSINDVLSSVIVMISLRVAKQPADEKHPYGHNKAEYIAIGVVSGILAVGVLFVLFYSVSAIVNGTEGAPHFIAFVVAALSFAVSTFLTRYAQCAAYCSASPVLHTSAAHNHADAVSSIAVMVGVGSALMGMHVVDPLVAVFETAHIMWLSGTLFGRSLGGLMDSALPREMIERITTACLSVPGVRELVELRSRQAGSESWVDLVVGVRSGLTVLQASELTKEVKKAIFEEMGPAITAQVGFRGEGTESRLRGEEAATHA